MVTKLTTTSAEEETVVAFVDVIPRGDTALVAAAKNVSRKPFETGQKTSPGKDFSWFRRM